MKIISSITRKPISLFLAFIFTAGILTAFFPLFFSPMIEVYASKDIEKDKLECNNVNLNLNGLDVSALSKPLSTLLQAQAEGEDAESGTSNFYEKPFSFVCVNNNDNEFITSPSAPIDLDLAVTNFESNNTSILLGNGNGTFDPAVNFRVGTGPNSVAIGDFNGDRVQDLAVANSGSNNTSILLGKGNGIFVPATPATVPVGPGPTSIAIGDFNHDTVQDLAVANGGSNSVSILLGNGNGTFASAVNFVVGGNPFSVAVGDFNGDRVQDLAVANLGSNGVSILLGNGNGTFVPATPATVVIGTLPFSVAVGNFNGDTAQDLVTANFFFSTVSILLGNGNGAFVPADPATVDVGVAPLFVAVGNFNRDTVQDLAVVNTGDTSNDVSILLGNGSGTFVPANPPTVPVGIAPQSVAIGDFNHDSVQDLAVTNFLSNDVSILLGKGNGTFSPAINFAVGTGPSSVAVGNFD